MPRFSVHATMRSHAFVFSFLVLLLIGTPGVARANSCLDRLSESVFDVVDRVTDEIKGKAFYIDTSRRLFITASHLQAFLDSPTNPAPEGDSNLRLKFEGHRFRFDVLTAGTGDPSQNFMDDWALLRLRLENDNDPASLAFSTLQPVALGYGAFQPSALIQGQVAIGPGGAMSLLNVKMPQNAGLACRPNAPILISLSGYERGHSGAMVALPQGTQCSAYAVTSRFALPREKSDDAAKQRYISYVYEYLQAKDPQTAAKLKDPKLPLSQQYEFVIQAIRLFTPVNIVPLRCIVDDLIRGSWTNTRPEARALIRTERSDISKRLIGLIEQQQNVADDEYERRLMREARLVVERYWQGGANWLDLVQTVDRHFALDQGLTPSKRQISRDILVNIFSNLRYGNLLGFYDDLKRNADNPAAIATPQPPIIEREATAFLRANQAWTPDEDKPLLGLQSEVDYPKFVSSPGQRVAMATRLLRTSNMVGPTVGQDDKDAKFARDMATTLLMSAMRDAGALPTDQKVEFNARAAVGLAQIALLEPDQSTIARQFVGLQPIERDLAMVGLKRLPSTDVGARQDASTVLAASNFKTFDNFKFDNPKAFDWALRLPPNQTDGPSIWDKSIPFTDRSKQQIWKPDFGTKNLEVR